MNKLKIVSITLVLFAVCNLGMGKKGDEAIKAQTVAKPGGELVVIKDSDRDANKLVDALSGFLDCQIYTFKYKTSKSRIKFETVAYKKMSDGSFSRSSAGSSTTVIEPNVEFEYLVVYRVGDRKGKVSISKDGKGVFGFGFSGSPNYSAFKTNSTSSNSEIIKIEKGIRLGETRYHSANAKTMDDTNVVFKLSLEMLEYDEPEKSDIEKVNGKK